MFVYRVSDLGFFQIITYIYLKTYISSERFCSLIKIMCCLIDQLETLYFHPSISLFALCSISLFIIIFYMFEKKTIKLQYDLTLILFHTPSHQWAYFQSLGKEPNSCCSQHQDTFTCKCYLKKFISILKHVFLNKICTSLKM